MAHEFEERYRTGETPWDIGKPDFNLIRIVTTTSIEPGRALEIGCGTGDNAIWLAQQKFDVLALDISGVAIEKAKVKAHQAGVACHFRVADILKTDLQETPFRFVFDRGCFHTMDSVEERAGFVKQVHRYLGESGLWLSLIGNADENRVGHGPPRRSAGAIVGAVEPYFEILSLVSSQFETTLPEPPRAWVCLVRKRKME